MSWQAYVDNMIASGHCTEAMICGIDGSLWAKSASMTHDPAEVKAIVDQVINNPSAQANGIRLCAKKYMFIKSDGEHSMQGKKGQDGISIDKCKQCILIVTYGDGMQPGNCAVTVGKMRDYLVDAGF